VLQDEACRCLKGDYRRSEEVDARLIPGAFSLELLESFPGLLLDAPEAEGHELLRAVGDVGCAGALPDPRSLGLDPLIIGEVTGVDEEAMPRRGVDGDLAVAP
jgi:hypothetical protein